MSDRATRQLRFVLLGFLRSLRMGGCDQEAQGHLERMLRDRLDVIAETRRQIPPNPRLASWILSETSGPRGWKPTPHAMSSEAERTVREALYGKRRDSVRVIEPRSLELVRRA